MTDVEHNIRISLLQTLSFLGSVDEQEKFASKVFYRDYVGEFACWWFDMFYPDEYPGMFSHTDWQILGCFSAEFDLRADDLAEKNLSIEDLLQSEEWKAVVQSAQTAWNALETADKSKI